MMKKQNILKLAIPVAALAIALLSTPAIAVSTECSDSPSIVVLPDCTTISITTCYCEVPSGGDDTLAVVVADLDNTVADDTPACDGSLCASNGDLAADVRVDGIQRRNGKSGNATRAKNGKGTADATCTDCPGTSVNIDTDAASPQRKNSHFDLLLEESDDTFVCKVGFQTHTQTCDP